MIEPLTLVVVGGGAAGFFGAITAAQTNPHARVILLEKAKQVLSKVRISGGGRCNVTHACYDPALLVRNYPRGGKALLGPFSRFQPRDTCAWFTTRGVSLKTESDGRIFPVSDSSETIIHCLMKEAAKSGVQLRTECGVTTIARDSTGFLLTLTNGEQLRCNRILMATGSAAKSHSWLETLGHTVQPPVPSLFTFNIPDSPFQELAGISVSNARLHIVDTGLEQSGPLLITHWGFSGPAVLKLSAWGARTLQALDYKAILRINWLADFKPHELRQKLLDCKHHSAARQIATEVSLELPRNLWKKFISLVNIPPEQRWAMLSTQQLEKLIQQLQAGLFHIKGKSTHKEEFVTCGGISLDEVNFKTMESRIVPGLFLAGEVLDIDGITGGFNFQNAWTTSWIAGGAMGTGIATGVTGVAGVAG